MQLELLEFLNKSILYTLSFYVMLVGFTANILGGISDIYYVDDWMFFFPNKNVCVQSFKFCFEIHFHVLKAIAAPRCFNIYALTAIERCMWVQNLLQCSICPSFHFCWTFDIFFSMDESRMNKLSFRIEEIFSWSNS